MSGSSLHPDKQLVEHLALHLQSAEPLDSAGPPDVDGTEQSRQDGPWFRFCLDA